MIKSISLTNPIGQTLNLVLEDPYTTGICVTKIEGLGYPQSNVQKQKIENASTSIYQGDDTESRNIVLTVAIFGNPTVESSRHLLYNYLWAKCQTNIEIATDEITVHTEGYIETVEPDIFSKQETIQVSIVCLDPYLYTGGKTFYKSNSLLFGKPNFQLSLEQESNWFDDSNQKNYQGVYGVPVAVSDDLSEDFVMLEFFSRFQNPRGFTLTIKNKFGKESVAEDEEPGSFNQVVITHQDGSILVNSLGVVPDEFTKSPEDNFFHNAQLVIQNDVYHQGIYLKRDGQLEDILDKCIIYGDYPCLHTGNNYFKCETKGLVKEVTNSPMIPFGEPINRLMGSSVGSKGYYFTIPSRAEYIVMDVYKNDPSSLEVKEENYICRLTLRPDQSVPQRIGILTDETTKYQYQCKYRLEEFNTSGGTMYYYITCSNQFGDPYDTTGINMNSVGNYILFNGNRLLQEQINDRGDETWYILACYADPSNSMEISTFRASWISLNVEISNSTVPNPMNYLHHFFPSTAGNSPGTTDEYLGYNMQARVIVRSIVELVIPTSSTEVYYQTSYKNNSDASEIIVEHDEFYDAL